MAVGVATFVAANESFDFACQSRLSADCNQTPNQTDQKCRQAQTALGYSVKSCFSSPTVTHTTSSQQGLMETLGQSSTAIASDSPAVTADQASYLQRDYFPEALFGVSGGGSGARWSAARSWLDSRPASFQRSALVVYFSGTQARCEGQRVVVTADRTHRLSDPRIGILWSDDFRSTLPFNDQ